MANLTHGWLVFNEASGSNSDDTLARLDAALAGAGVTITRRIAVPVDKLPTGADLDAGGVSLLIVFTGDGTLRSMLTAVEGWGGAVLVLPGGTTNLLSKAIHGDRSLDEIVADLPLMQRRRRKCLRSPMGTAVIEVLAGPGAKWSDVREGMREGDVVAVATTTLEAVQASAGDSLVAIVAPQLGKPEGYSGVRLVPEDDGIVVDGYGAATVLDYLKQGVALLQRDFRNGPHDELGLHPGLTLASVDGSEIELMLDGERECAPQTVTFSLAELAVDLLSA